MAFTQSLFWVIRQDAFYFNISSSLMPQSPADRLTPLTRGQLVEHQVSTEAPSPSGFGFLWSLT